MGNWENTLPVAVLPGITHYCGMPKYTNLVNLINAQARAENKTGVVAKCLRMPGVTTNEDESKKSIWTSELVQAQQFCIAL